MAKKKRHDNGGVQAPDPPQDQRQDDDSDTDSSGHQDGAASGPHCLHLNKALVPNRVRKTYKARDDRDGDLCVACRAAGTPALPGDTLAVCLRCGAVRCSRVHAPQHALTPHSDCHALSMELAEWTVRCHVCETTVAPDATKKLLELVEFFKRNAPLPAPQSLPIPLGAPPPPPPPLPSVGVSYVGTKPTVQPSGAFRVRGLSNLGNTCFFNSVLQCLVQTPYLTEVLREMAEPGETFTLQGGELEIETAESEGEEPEKKTIELPPIRGELRQWGSLTQKLADTLAELQAGGSTGVYDPRDLHSVLVRKMTQFGGGDQHDSHELLRHLLEAVRSEDLKRYRQVILKELDLATNARPSEVDDATKQKIKFYDRRASDRMLRPEQVFRGFLVSTLECQECGHASDRSEYFLDLSLPVVADKPQPPALLRRKGQDDSISCPGAIEDGRPTKHRLKKEKQAAKKAARKNKRAAAHDASLRSEEPARIVDGESSSERSDADCEDNAEDPLELRNGGAAKISRGASEFLPFASFQMESGYNSEKLVSSDSIRASPVESDQREKSDDTPERADKDVPNRLSATAIPLEYRPLSLVETPQSNPDSGVASPETAKLAPSGAADGDALGVNGASESPVSSPSRNGSDGESRGAAGYDSRLDGYMGFDKFMIDRKSHETEKDERTNVSGCSKLFLEDLNLNNNYSPDSVDWNAPGPSPPRLVGPEPDPSEAKETSPFAVGRPYSISPRYQNDNEGYSVQSCLNQFTMSELLTGNNKVGCEECTKRVDNGKTVYTNATKRFLISSPPAILILHLKRFQFGSRFMLSKLTKHVNFSTVLDLAPFCTEAAKNNGRNLYALYGVVEHCGGMHSGHYVAYVKVRPRITPEDERWSFLPRGDEAGQDRNGSGGAVNGNDDTDSSLSGYESGEAAAGRSDAEAPPGKWYYASDSCVQETSEDKVLKAKAYLLFYERIL